MNTHRWPFAAFYALLAGLLLGALLLSVRAGAVSIDFNDIGRYLSHALRRETTTDIREQLFLQIRLPRVILCTLVGAALSVSGALMQALFRNPIVEPGLVGTSSGAALGAAFVFVMGQTLQHTWIGFAGPLLLPLFAFAGGLAATLLVYRLSGVFGKTNVNTLLLAGIAVNALGASGTGFFSYVARDPQARSIVFWNLGTLSGADWNSVAIVGASTLGGLALSLRLGKALNALMLGETDAGYLGVRTARLKRQVILINTLLVAVATAFVGVIGFVGLIVPHILRLLKSADNRFLIPASALLGGLLLNLADVLTRTIVAPSEFPIGIVTALAGAPVFLFLLVRNNRKLQKGGFYA